MNWKKIAFGLPSALSAFFTLMISYVYLFIFIPSLSKKVSYSNTLNYGIYINRTSKVLENFIFLQVSLVLAILCTVTHLFFVVMTLWSLFKTFWTDPGYISKAFLERLNLKFLIQTPDGKLRSNPKWAVWKMNKEHYRKSGLLIQDLKDESVEITTTHGDAGESSEMVAIKRNVGDNNSTGSETDQF